MATARFTPAEATGTIFQQAKGVPLSVTLPTGNRVVLLVSEADSAKVRTGRAVEVTDLMTNQSHALVPSACGLGCRCGIAFAGVR